MHVLITIVHWKSCCLPWVSPRKVRLANQTCLAEWWALFRGLNHLSATCVGVCVWISLAVGSRSLQISLPEVHETHLSMKRETFPELDNVRVCLRAWVEGNEKTQKAVLIEQSCPSGVHPTKADIKWVKKLKWETLLRFISFFACCSQNFPFAG